jgi:hypothetical protein
MNPVCIPNIYKDWFRDKGKNGADAMVVSRKAMR